MIVLLTICQRTPILKGAACGITYLHNQPPCLHHDINLYDVPNYTYTQ